MSLVKARLYRGDLVVNVKPMSPFYDEHGKEIGHIVSAEFDGEYTVVTICMHDQVPGCRGPGCGEN